MVAAAARGGAGAGDERGALTGRRGLRAHSIPSVRAGQARYDLEVHGPNGFLRAFRGAPAGVSRANVAVKARYRSRGLGLELTLRNRSAQPAQVRITDQYSGESLSHRLRAGESEHDVWSTARLGGWYDLVITVAGDADFRVQLAGRIESGRDSISDPAFGQRGS